MRTVKIVDYLLGKLPKKHLRWCHSELCACMGCVNSIVTRDEWEDWCGRHNYCDACKRYEDGTPLGIRVFDKSTNRDAEHRRGGLYFFINKDGKVVELVEEDYLKYDLKDTDFSWETE
jgi:hypothetical protein